MTKRRNGSTTAVLEQRALQILTDCNILDLKYNRYKIASQLKKELYYTVTRANSWTCTCEYYVSGHNRCKHIIALEMLTLNVDKLVPTDFLIQEPDIQCTKCGSANYTHSEDRHLKHGISTRYRCRDCNSKFTWRPGSLGRHYNVEVITRALEDRATGKSLATTARPIPKNPDLGVKTAPDRSTVYWENYAGNAGLKVTKNIPIRVSGRWAVDEIYYKVCRIGKYLFGVMDTESRFMLANEVCMSDYKMGHNPTGLFEHAIKIAGKVPQVLVSDSLKGFALAFKNTISKRCKKQKPIHIHNAAVQKRHLNNNMYERYNGTIRDRIKIVRGFNSEHLGTITTVHHVLQLYTPTHGDRQQDSSRSDGNTDRWRRQVKNPSSTCRSMLNNST